MKRLGCRKKSHLAIAGFLFLSSCTFLSNRQYVQQYPMYQGVRRVVIFLQRWPNYRQLPGQNDLGSDFIKKSTLFYGPWAPAGQINPRAVDVQDIDDCLVGELLIQVMQRKGYQPFLAGVLPSARGTLTVEEIMANYQVLDRQVDAYLFCFYSPTLYFSDAGEAPADHQSRSYNLIEINQFLHPGGNPLIWAGSRAGLAPPNSISHAFIYLSVTCFKAFNWLTLWQVADSQIGGQMRAWIPQCLPAPTDKDYRADAAVIKDLMCQNLSCRLRHIIPDAF